MKKIQAELQVIDLDGCDISIEESIAMVDFLKTCLSDLRDFFLSKDSTSTQEEIIFFKEMKPEVLGLLIYFSKIHDIELKRPTGSNDTHDYKIAKIISNEMLRIYLNKKLLRLEKQMAIDKNRELLPVGNMKWTGSKVAAVELGYALHTSPAINRGQTDIKDIMTFIETFFNIDLGDYYRTYITIRGRKKDRTAYLNSLIDGLIKKMDEDDCNE